MNRRRALPLRQHVTPRTVCSLATTWATCVCACVRVRVCACVRVCVNVKGRFKRTVHWQLQWEGGTRARVAWSWCDVSLRIETTLYESRPLVFACRPRLPQWLAATWETDRAENRRTCSRTGRDGRRVAGHSRRRPPVYTDATYAGHAAGSALRRLPLFPQPPLLLRRRMGVATLPEVRVCVRWGAHES